MTELKTLKDIEFVDYTYQGNCDEEDVREKIKQEAIKWVQKLHILREDNVVIWIKQFFNITEEDLK